MSVRQDIEETERVRRHTPPDVNAQIDAVINANIRRYTGASREALSRRIDELDREWDIERVLEANASSFSLLGLLLSRVHSRRWLLLSTGVAGFLLQHALQGWCPPVSVFRRMGIRTRQEIDREKYALKYMRGDFEDLAKYLTGQPNTASEGHPGR